MSGGLIVNLRGKKGEDLEIKSFRAGFEWSAQELEEACERAAAPGLSAFRANVGQVHRVTGNLAASPAMVTRTYVGNGRIVGIAVVGYDKAVAPHGHLVEYGTGPRKSRKGFRGSAQGLFPLARAYDTAYTVMQSRLSAELTREATRKLAAAG